MIQLENKEEGYSPSNRRETYLYNQHDEIEYFLELLNDNVIAKEEYDRLIHRELKKEPGDEYVLREFEYPMFGKLKYNITKVDNDRNVYGQYESGYIFIN